MTIELIDLNYKPAVELFESFQQLRIKRVQTPSESADVTIVCIVGDQSAHYLENTHLPENGFLIFCVFTLTGSVIPYLEMADQVIWFGPMQERIVKEIAGFTYPGKSIEFPVEPIISQDKGNVFCAVGNAFDSEQLPWYREVISCAKNWFSCSEAGTITILFAIESTDSESFETFRTEIEIAENDPRLQLLGTHECSTSVIRDLIANASTGEYFRQEQTVAQIEEQLSEKNIALLFTPFYSDATVELLRSADFTFPAGSGGVLRSTLSSDSKILTIDQFEINFIHLIEIARPMLLSERAERVASIAIDSLETLDIIHGKPLSNQYIFSICFRNQEKKIVRALESIIAQNGSFDCGIAIVDDGSTDRSSELILEYLSDKKNDFVLVKNNVRRFASRNFYNIINFLTTGDSSVIIELDGDDFLHGTDVLTRLEQEYSKGILKTSGSFITYPDSDTQVAKTLLDRRSQCDFTRPWSLSTCNSWLPLRSCHRSVASQVELPYFLDRVSGTWLAERHDSITNSRMIEIAGADRCSHIDEPLYVYDLSGIDHDHGDSEEFDRSAAFIKLLRDLDHYYRAYSL